MLLRAAVRARATVATQALDQQQRGGATERDKPAASAEERRRRAYADEGREDTTEDGPSTATSSRLACGSPSAGTEYAIQPATTPNITQAARPISLPFR
jgi:hypothetical protein